MIIDVFPFFNEYELLKLRMEMLKGVVDMHLAICGTHTYQGEKRNFDLDDDLIFRFDLDDDLWGMYAHIGGDYASAWEREAALRRSIPDCIKYFSPSDDDLIIYTDADEIPNPEVIDRWPRREGLGIHALKMRTFYYGTQWEDPSPTDRGKIFYWDMANDLDWNDLRWGSPKYGTWDLPSFEDAGWHISYYGGKGRIRTKLQSFSHVEYSNDRHIRRIQRGAATGRGPNNERLVAVDQTTLPNLLRHL